MGFRKDAFATVWEVKPISDNLTRARISISRKDKQTGGYVQDFGGYVSFVGTACVKKALRLKEKERIKLGDVDVNNRFDKQHNTTYTNFNVYSFEPANASSQDGNVQPETPMPSVDDGELSEELPF